MLASLAPLFVLIGAVINGFFSVVNWENHELA